MGSIPTRLFLVRSSTVLRSSSTFRCTPPVGVLAVLDQVEDICLVTPSDPSQTLDQTLCLYCAILYCTVLYCTVLYCTVLYCNPYTPYSSRFHKSISLIIFYAITASYIPSTTIYSRFRSSASIRSWSRCYELSCIQAHRVLTSLF